DAPGIATISSTGLVTGISVGPATVSASAPNGTTGTSAVTVTGTLIATGDIAHCGNTNDDATSLLVDNIPGTVAVLGDNAYPVGAPQDYANCSDPSWGRHKARTKPSGGNHEYYTAGAAGYFGYFGAAAGNPSEGWYSYDLGSWHIVVLNSNCGVIACDAGSPQDQWLRADLAATLKPCILAYFHHPRWSSDGEHGNDATIANFWDALYEVGADVVLNGHAHVYERFAPMNPSGAADPVNGIRQITVGVGGRFLVQFRVIHPNSQVRNNQTFGVLQMTLGDGPYSWNFVPVAGKTFTDSGNGACH
ncbi:MAG: metallophosphoesterase, partial [Gemmatimonadaceae bacterium]